MKRLAIILALLASPAIAQPVTLVLTDADQQTLAQSLDALIKSQGLVSVTNGTAAAVQTLYQKLVAAAQASPPAPDAPQGGTK